MPRAPRRRRRASSSRRRARADVRADRLRGRASAPRASPLRRSPPRGRAARATPTPPWPRRRLPTPAARAPSPSETPARTSGIRSPGRSRPPCTSCSRDTSRADGSRDVLSERDRLVCDAHARALVQACGTGRILRVDAERDASLARGDRTLRTRGAGAPAQSLVSATACALRSRRRTRRPDRSGSLRIMAAISSPSRTMNHSVGSKSGSFTSRISRHSSNGIATKFHSSSNASVIAS